MPTIKDVAKKANVSVATVSRVINNTGYVNEETRQIVLKAIKELEYIPNELARSLFKKQSKIIGLIVPHLTTYFFAELIEALEESLASRGYKLMIFNAKDEIEREKRYMQVFNQYNIDGIILAAHSTQYKDYLDLNIPIITIDHTLDEKVPSVTSDNETGGRLAAQKFVDTKCKKVIHLQGPSFLLTVLNRNKGFKDVITEAGIELHTVDLAFVKPDFNLIYNFIGHHKDVDGIFCSSDVLALHALRALHKLGKKVPEDVQVIGFDNIELCELVTPNLSTIDQSIETIAEEATKTLVSIINKNETIAHKVIPVNLIERESTKNS
ncbi:MAG: LacI family DNA-binding transcriptional regulator [Candidatus Izemoplasmataceae bacterium]